MIEIENYLSRSKAFSERLNDILGAPEEPRIIPNNCFIPPRIFSNTRGYLEKLVIQVNGCYSYGWFDGVYILTRRILETLIIECFIQNGIETKIKDQIGNFLGLEDLISKLENENWNISRNSKQALAKIKKFGDNSAHNRRFIAIKADVESIKDDARIAFQELISIAHF